MARDSQRKRVYDAERIWESGLPLRKKWRAPLEECDDLIKALWAMCRWSDSPSPVLGGGKGRKTACGEFEYIELPEWARTWSLVCHELAHSIMGGFEKRNKKLYPAHGPEFCRIYIDLVEIAIGKKEAVQLETCLTANNVKVSGSMDWKLD